MVKFKSVKVTYKPEVRWDGRCWAAWRRRPGWRLVRCLPDQHPQRGPPEAVAGSRPK